MHDRHPIAWRLLTMVGVALTLLLNLQQAHALCALDACGGDQHEHESAAEGELAASRCCHNRLAAAAAESGRHVLAEAVPCDADCWLCHAAIPWAAISGMVNSAALEIGCPIAAASYQRVVGLHASGALPSRAESPDWSKRTTDCLCAELCRFLI